MGICRVIRQVEHWQARLALHAEGASEHRWQSTPACHSSDRMTASGDIDRVAVVGRRAGVDPVMTIEPWKGARYVSSDSFHSDPSTHARAERRPLISPQSKSSHPRLSRPYFSSIQKPPPTPS